MIIPKHGKTPEQILREKTKEGENEKEAVKSFRMIDGNDLGLMTKFLLKLQMGDEDREQLEVMLKGCSTQEIIEHYMNRDVSDEETAEKLCLKRKWRRLEKLFLDEQILAQ